MLVLYMHTHTLVGKNKKNKTILGSLFLLAKVLGDFVSRYSQHMLYFKIDKFIVEY